MKRVVDIEAKKVTKEPLKESYSERRKTIDDKKKLRRSRLQRQPKIGQSKATTVDQGMGCQVNIVFA
jgi:hypothetical protein